MKAREGDLLETCENLIFDVKGLIHPVDRVIAFVRYFPDGSGRRTRRGRAFEKVYSLSRRYDLLQSRFPQYLLHDPVFDETLCEVPVDRVLKHYKPVENLRRMRSSKSLDFLEAKAVQFAELLKKRANVPWNALGISGSIMIGLHTLESDIDPVVYGSRNCKKVYSALKTMLEMDPGPVRPYTRRDLQALYDFRSKDTQTGFEDFIRTESRKTMQGKFSETDYFVRFVKDWNEIDENYGDVQYENMGDARVEARVIDDSQSIFTPCAYKVENTNSFEGGAAQHVDEITSFRGRFCEQAKEGETVVAVGKVERVMDRRRDHRHYRLLVGGKPSHYLIVKERTLSNQ